MTTSSSERPRVLLVDDYPDAREMYSEYLRLSGFEVVEASNGLEALQRAALDAPDIILMDLSLPVMDGWEFRRRQVEDPSIAGVPVVVLSALDQARGFDLVGTAFLKKPLDFDRLLELVRRFCSSPGC